MPEGDTLYRTATTLRKALVGQVVTEFETTVTAVAVVAEEHPVAGRRVSAVDPRGKHLLITLIPPEQEPSPPAGPPVLVLHTHLRMTGSWHLYRPAERWQKPPSYARVVLHTASFVAPCFSAPVVELLTQNQAERHADLRGLGPDAITEEFDLEAALARLQQHGDTPIGVALLNQRVFAGVGNVYKSEVLFLGRVSPFTPVAEVPVEKLRSLLADSHRLLRLNRARGVRRTHNSLRDDARLWAYGRTGEPCRVCGHPIRMRRQGMDARSTYFCEVCQAP
jgi:endonuclease-8